MKKAGFIYVVAGLKDEKNVKSFGYWDNERVRTAILELQAAAA